MSNVATNRQPKINVVTTLCASWVNESPNNVLDKILILKKCIKYSLPESKIIISNIIGRLNNGKAVLSIKRLNQHLCSFEVNIVNKSNIGKESLGEMVLHLNPRGCSKLAINFIKKKKTTRTCKRTNMMLVVFKITIISLRQIT